MARITFAPTLAVLLATCSSPGSRGGEADYVGQRQVDSLQARINALEAADRQRVADSIHRELTTPRHLSLISGNAEHSIPAPQSGVGGFQAFGFTLSKPGHCKIIGRVEVLRGGNRDVIVSVLGHDEFTNWRNSRGAVADVLFQAGPQTVVNLAVPIPQAGTYYLVISNRFSTVTAKAITGSAEVTCMGAPVPIAAP